MKTLALIILSLLATLTIVGIFIDVFNDNVICNYTTFALFGTATGTLWGIALSTLSWRFCFAALTSLIVITLACFLLIYMMAITSTFQMCVPLIISFTIFFFLTQMIGKIPMRTTGRALL
ncbi:MAG: hypothetical protein WCV69_03425 [Patescibacteria group bacterium]|jgi:hypothetical protein